MVRPTKGIATDAAHSMKNGKTEYRAIDLATKKQIFYRDLGNQTTNIGEFLGVVAAAKYIIENNFEPPIIYTDSMTAIAWFKAKKTSSVKVCRELQKAEMFLRALSADIDEIEIVHWDNKRWGEIPADFGNKVSSSKKSNYS